MSQYNQLSIERFPDGVALVKLQNPPLNLLNPGLLTELCELFEELDKDDALRAVVLTGTSRAFCAGWTVTEKVEAGSETNIGQDCYNRIESSRLPVIAAIDGYCLGGGLELALACDIQIGRASCRERVWLRV